MHIDGWFAGDEAVGNDRLFAEPTKPDKESQAS
jgi:hypothetical protein